MGFDQSAIDELEGQDISPASIETEKVTNSKIGDGVNYIDPRFLVRSKAYITEVRHESIDSASQLTTGSGKINNPNLEVEVDTGTTDGSIARVTKKIETDIEGNKLDFNADMSISTGFRIVDSDSELIGYLTTGEIVNDDQSGIGIKIVTETDPKIQGVVHDGTSESTTDLITNPGTGRFQLRIEFAAGSEVEWFSDGVSEGTLSSGLPSGSVSGFHGLVEVHAENTSAVQRRLRTGQFRVVQLP